jgi:hypothetical protein
MWLLISKSTANNYVAPDSEISSQIVLVPIKKLAAKNHVTADSEIGSQKL